MKKICGIYEIRSRIYPNRVYIGSSIDIIDRWRKHKRGLRNGNHHNKKLQRHYNKYGPNDLFYKIIMECPEDSLINYEQFLIDANSAYFNLAPADRCLLGVGRIPWNKGLKSPYNEDTLRRMSEGHIGLTNPNYWKDLPYEQKIASIERMKGNKYCLGRRHTKEAIKKIKESHFGDKNGMFGKVSHNAKMVINLETGIFYDSIRQAAFSAGLHAYSLERALKNPLKNKTKFILL